MAIELKSKYTRFRAYQLGQKGSLYSYYDGTDFTLIEAMLTESVIPQINEELIACGFKKGDRIACLHITSWDSDHCESKSLAAILNILKPRRIEFPGYPIKKEIQNQVDCAQLIVDYYNELKKEQKTVVAKSITPGYCNTLVTYTKWTYRNVLFSNKKDYAESNNNSTIKLFRTGSFTVLSLGDIDHENIKKYLLKEWLVKNEVDVLLIAHHGAANKVNVKDFFKEVAPTVVVCTSNYDNQFKHPRQSVRNYLSELSIPLKTTKNGDVIITSTGDDKRNFSVQDLKANSTEQKGRKINYKSKRAKYYDKENNLSSNEDIVEALRKILEDFGK